MCARVRTTRCGSRLCRLGELRDPPIGRVDDERGPVVELPLDEPERVVVAGDDVEVLELGIAQRLLNEPVAEQIASLFVVTEPLDTRGEIGQLLVGERGLARQLLRSFHRRRAVVRPDALQVRLAIRCARRRPGSLTDDGCRGERKQREHHQHDGNRSTVHLTLLPRAGHGAALATLDAGRVLCKPSDPHRRRPGALPRVPQECGVRPL